MKYYLKRNLHFIAAGYGIFGTIISALIFGSNGVATFFFGNLIGLALGIIAYNLTHE